MLTSSSSSSLTQDNTNGRKRTDNNGRKEKKSDDGCVFLKRKKVTTIKFLGQTAPLKRILLTKIHTEKHRERERERESCWFVVSAFCFRGAERRTHRCWYSRYGPSSQRCTGISPQNSEGGWCDDDEWEKNRPTEKRVPEPPEIKSEETETIRPTVAHIKSNHRAEV